MTIVQYPVVNISDELVVYEIKSIKSKKASGPRRNPRSNKIIKRTRKAIKSSILTSILGRIHREILKSLLEEENKHLEIEKHASFNAGRSCKDYLFTLKHLNGKKWLKTDKQICFPKI